MLKDYNQIKIGEKDEKWTDEFRLFIYKYVWFVINNSIKQIFLIFQIDKVA